MAGWFYLVGGEVRGPISSEALKEKLAKGELTPDCPVGSSPDALCWEIRQVPELAAGSSPAGEGAEAVGVASTVADSSLAHPEPEPGPTDALAGSAALDVSEQGVIPGATRSPLALRPCSDCGWMVSRQASVCPRCGRLFHEASSVLVYRGEHPVPVIIFFSVLAVLFVLSSPFLVYFWVSFLGHRFLGEEGATGLFPLGFTAAYIVSMVVCALLGGAVGKPRMAYLTGLFLGLFFGPLGVFAAYAIDKRPQCCHCLSRLDGLARECPHCHARLLWKVQPSWY